MSKRTHSILVVVLSIMLALLTVEACHAQEYRIQGDSLVQVGITNTKDVKTKLVVNKSGVNYPVWKSKRGKYYIIRISGNTGKEYKQYLKIKGH